MPNHYSDVGFKIEKQEDIPELIDSLFEQGETIPAVHGDYRRMIVDDHIEFWLQLKRNNALALEFHYASPNRNTMKFIRYVKNKSNTKMGGAILVNSDVCPLVVDVPNLDLFRKLKEDQPIHLQVAAFADIIELYDNEEDYHAAQAGEEPQFAAECFIPTGSFMLDKKAPPEAYAMFSGFIESFDKRVNSMAGGVYYHIVVKCQDSKYDVVADEALVTKEPMVGGILRGEYWISGKIVE